jgi:MSHA biogenesis protein MshO
MRPTHCPDRVARPRSAEGFSLIELTVVIAVAGIVAAAVALFITRPIEGYLGTVRRAELADAADTAARRMARELRAAVPNSVRVNGAGTAVELLLARSGGRYRAEPTGSGAGDVLDFASATDNSFDVAGPAVEAASGDQIVVYNLGIPGADAYAGDTRRAYAGAAGSVTNIAFAPAGAPYPFASPASRFQVAEGPVSYVCDLAAGTLRRYAGYPIVAAQAVPPAGGGGALLAEDVTACRITYDPVVIAQRAGLVTVELTLSRDGEQATLYHAVHVGNVP